jgi:hypothetical protein
MQEAADKTEIIKIINVNMYMFFKDLKINIVISPGWFLVNF